MSLLVWATIALSALMGIAALASVFLRHPVRAVLALIAAFTFGAAQCVLFGADFLAMVLMVVYVGAVAVLFLFVLMMLDLERKHATPEDALPSPVHTPVAVVIAGVFAAVFGAVVLHYPPLFPPKVLPVTALQVGHKLFTDNVVLFQMSGLVLTVAMVGAIVLTLRHRAGVRTQNATDQVLRDPKDCVQLVKIAAGAPLPEGG